MARKWNESQLVDAWLAKLEAMTEAQRADLRAQCNEGLVLVPDAEAMRIAIRIYDVRERVNRKK